MNWSVGLLPRHCILAFPIVLPIQNRTFSLNMSILNTMVARKICIITTTGVKS